MRWRQKIYHLTSFLNNRCAWGAFFVASIHFTFLPYLTSSSVFMVDTIHFNTLLPTFKQKTGNADCLWACVCARVCARQGRRFPVDARLSGISPAGVRVQRMCVTVASPLPTAGCDAPSHKSCRTPLKHTSSHAANQRKHTPSVP